MSPRRLLLPLVLATIATQSAIVVLAPLVVEIGRDFGASVGAVGMARSVLAGTAVLVSLAIGPLIDRVGVGPLIAAGAALALGGAAATAAAPSLLLFYTAHVISGAGVACLLSAGFAGVAAHFELGEVPWAMGYVVGAQSIAWIAGTPVIGFLADHGSWRLAYAVPGTVALLALAAAGALMRSPDAPAEPASARPDAARGLGAVFRDRSSRRWVTAELVAYSAWTAELTYAGAFYIQSYGTGESAVGVLLAVGSVVFLLASLSTARLTRIVPRRRLIAATALGMGAVLALILNVTPSVWFTLGLFCAMALFAGVRSTGSSALGLAQLPERPGAMMGARTAGAQLGYMVGAAAGAAILAIAGFGALGFVLAAGMACSAALVLRVSDPGVEAVSKPPANTWRRRICAMRRPRSAQ